ncbi:MAG: outer membrane receptor protein [Bacteroidetes bacterium]|nr:MAG: outer membrane receptor protein [Bacteroidota bacterium]
MKKSILLFMMVAFAAIQLFSQTKLTGRIIELASGEALTGAHIRLIPSNQHKISASDGTFVFNSLKPGNLQIEVSFIGFEKQLLNLNLLNDTSIQIVMPPSAFLQDEVVVSASRVTNNQPITFSVLSSEAIQKNNQGTDLPYLLQSTPSVVVSSDAGAGIGYTNLRIRGTDLTRINVTLNGVPVNDPESHAVFFVNLPDLASSVENIQIQRGVGTSSNGVAAFGASINIKTSDRSDKPFGTLSSSAGSFNSFKNTLQFGTGTSKNGFSLDGRLSKINSEGYIDRGWSDLKSFYLSGTWANKSTMVKLIATSGIEQTYQSWYGIPKDSLNSNRTYNPAGEIIDNEGNSLGFYDNQTDNYQQDYYQFHLAHQISPSVLFTGAAFLTRGKGFYESWKNDQKLSSYGYDAVQVGNEVIERTDLIQQKWLDNYFFGGQASVYFTTKSTSNTFGAGWNRYEGDHYGLISWAKHFPNTSLDTPWYFNDGEKTDFHIFAKSTYQLTTTIALFGDLQYRSIDYVIEGIHDDLGDITQSHNFRFFNPKAGINIKFSSRWGAYASIAVSNREPNRSVYRDADSGQVILPERLINYETGARFESAKLKFETNLFFMDYHNQLVLTGKINNVGSAILTNVETSYRAGWETSASLMITPKIQFSGHFTLSTNKIKNFTEYVDNWNYWDDPETEPYQFVFERGTTDISFSPNVTASASVSWMPFSNFEIAYQSQYVSRQFIDNTSNEYRSIDPYHIGNMRVNYELTNSVFRKTTIGLQMNNLFNTKYETNAWVYRYYYNNEPYQLDGYFPQAGFHWMLQLTLGI